MMIKIGVFGLLEIWYKKMPQQSELVDKLENV